MFAFCFFLLSCALSYGVYSNLATIFVGELHCFGRCLLSSVDVMCGTK